MIQKISLILYATIAILGIHSCTPPTSSHSIGKMSEPVLSLMGKQLLPLSESHATMAKKDSLLQVAYDHFQNDSTDLNYIIWYGRRLAYLYRYHQAIDVFSQGMTIHPNSAELYRHRGHRYLSIRKFEKAAKDLKRAAQLAGGREVEIEPDGQPNRLNIPLSTLQFNIYYHWALAHYLMGEFETAAAIYDTCMAYSTNPDLLVATTDWHYMTLQRLGYDKEANQLLELISEDLQVIENTSYLKRLLMYKGLMSPEDLLDLNNDAEDAQVDIVTQGYGVGNWYLYNRDTSQAVSVFKKILDCDYWPAFGYIAAEADYRRLNPENSYEFSAHRAND